MIDYETLLEDDEYLEDFDDGEDEDLFDYDDDGDYSDDGFGERRRRRRRRRRAPRIGRPRTARGRGFVKPRGSKAPVSVSTLQASLERVGKDIRTNATAIKSLGLQVKSATKKLNDENNRQNSAISDARSDLKKHVAAAAQTNQLNLLLPLLQKSPELEPRPGGDGDDAKKTIANVQIKKQDNTTALVIAMMASQQTGGASAGGGLNTMLPLILLLDK